MFCFGSRGFGAFSGPSSFVPAGPQTLLFTAPQPLWRSKWPFGLASGPLLLRNGWSGLLRRSKWPFGLASGPLLLRNGWSGLLRCHFWRSKWLLGPPGARNGCSGLPRCRQSARNGRLSLHRCRQSARNGRSGMPLCRQSARNGRSGIVLCHTGSKIALEVAFEIAVRRICARCHETLLHYALLCMACAWICTGSH